MRHPIFRKAVGFFTVLFLGMSFIAVTPMAKSAVDNPETSTPPNNETLQQAAENDKSQSPLHENDVSRFTNTIALINEFYVKSIDDKKLLEDAIRGIVAGLDPHSEYLDEEAYKTLMMETSGEFGGVGIEVTSEYDVLKVISPVDGTPAARAGIKPGDYIVEINNRLVNNMSLQEAVNAIHGKKGTQLMLTVLRKGEGKPIKFNLTRDTIRIDAVKSKMLADNFGYIRIGQFQEATPDLMVKAIEELKKSNHGDLSGLIIDLRNNPGGLLDSAVKVVNVFLDSNKLPFNKMIVYTKGHLPQLQYEAKATAHDMLKGAPIVILINEGSASASEIVTGALQDYHRALVVGVPSFGKGSVQTVIPLDKTHAVKLTTALYYTPAGRQIQNKGIIPDVIVENIKVANGSSSDSLILGPIREFELKNHLQNQNGTNSTVSSDDHHKAAAVNTDYTDLAEKDFQLYEAVKILQAVYTMGNKTLVKN